MLVKLSSDSEELKEYLPLITKLSDSICDSDYVDPAITPLLKNAYCSLMSVSKDEIHVINKENRDVDSVTDVLSFPMLDFREGRLCCAVDECDFEMNQEGTRVFNLGDIVLCYDVAVEQSREYGHSVEREVLFLIAHSMLHLLGYDHIDPRDEKRMISKQKKLMTAIGLALEDEAESSVELEEPVYPAGSQCEHCGYVALLGRPNVGKSTLLNYISGMKVAIVSHKPQTTRTNIRSIYNTEDSQIIFVDTPGVHSPKSKMGEIMVERSFNSAKNADLVLFLADARFDRPGKVEKELLDNCRKSNKKVILAINKTDDISRDAQLPLIANYASCYDFADIVPISARTGRNVDVLLDVIKKHLSSGPRLFDSEYMTDQTEREMAKEFIREQVLHYTNQEIPHGVAVEITKFEDRYGKDSADEYDRELVVIEASIICERKSHKGIIIGKDGQMLKRIGTSARKNIERMTGCKCYLDLFVKYREDWKNDDTLLKQFGFTNEDE
ncbi:MAG: GTPase Era [Clostridiales bacterium]|nr:GTPase Era [Clostridiales bacterium]